MLLKSVFAVFQRATSAAESTLASYLALNSPRFDPEAIPARRRYLNRCSKLVTNVMRWRKYTGERFGIGMLITRFSTDCMLPVAESGWEVGGEDSIRKVSKSKSISLFP
jgi:GC-rich sequence DNA-binding factor